jgi:hypothetical protein
MNHDLDELRLQRLVDGALAGAERREFLRGADACPGRWREIALAFVEDRIWSDAIRAPVPESNDRAIPTRPVRERFGGWRKLLAVAAGLLLVLALGYRLGQWRSEPGTGRPSAERRPHGNHRDGSAGSLVEAESRAPFQDAVPPVGRIQLVYADGPSRQSLQVPVYDASHMHGDPWSEPDLTAFDELNRELSVLGYRVDWQTEYLAGDLADGRQLVVPIRAVALQYHGQ